MNRAEVVRGIAACEAMAKRLRAKLTAEAETEFVNEGMVPSWKLAGITVSGSLTHPSVAITDEAAFLAWASERYPTEVETVAVTRVRAAWQGPFLEGVAGRGNPPCDAQGEEIPGLEWRPGGSFGGISVRVDPEIKAVIAQHADEIADGVRPMALPVGVTV